jgi:hypothetical protein
MLYLARRSRSVSREQGWQHAPSRLCSPSQQRRFSRLETLLGSRRSRGRQARQGVLRSAGRGAPRADRLRRSPGTRDRQTRFRSRETSSSHDPAFHGDRPWLCQSAPTTQPCRFLASAVGATAIYETVRVATRHYNQHRPHTACGDQPPVSSLHASVDNVMTNYRPLAASTAARPSCRSLTKYSGTSSDGKCPPVSGSLHRTICRYRSCAQGRGLFSMSQG